MQESISYAVMKRAKEKYSTVSFLEFIPDVVS